MGELIGAPVRRREDPALLQGDGRYVDDLVLPRMAFMVVNVLGAKGCGEAGTIGSTPAVVNAVIDALEPFGVTQLDMPLNPARVWTATCRVLRSRIGGGRLAHPAAALPK